MISDSDELVTQAESTTSSGDETRQRILVAAAQIFSEKGYARATTRALAAAAGVNEVTLFRHFGSKEKLFAAVVDHYAAPSMIAALERLFTGDYRQDLLSIGNFFMQVILERQDIVRLMLCEAAHFPEVRRAMAQNPRQFRQVLARYLQQQMEQGRVRKLCPEAMAQAFWGMFYAYAINLEILEAPISPAISTEELIAQFVDIFVNGTIVRG